MDTSSVLQNTELVFHSISNKDCFSVGLNINRNILYYNRKKISERTVKDVRNKEHKEAV